MRGLNTHLCASYSPLAPCVTDINKGFNCFTQTAIPSFSVFSNWSRSPRSGPVCVSPLWMNGGFTQQYSKGTSPMKTFASLTRTHSIGKATVALEGTEGGLIDDKSWCCFFVRPPFQKRDHPQRELNSIHCHGFIFYIQQLYSGFLQ